MNVHVRNNVHDMYVKSGTMPPSANPDPQGRKHRSNETLERYGANSLLK